MRFILHFLHKIKILVYCTLPRKDQSSWLPTVIIPFYLKPQTMEAWLCHYR